MRCPRCMQPIGPDDPACPSCGAVIVLERKPTRADEERGWTLRHLASIMGRAGCLLLIAQNALVLVGAFGFVNPALAFLGRSDLTPDLAPFAGLVLVSYILDFVGLGLVAVALVVLGSGSMLLRRRDPFTEEEVMIPPTTAAFPMAAGLCVFAWVLFTAVWRVIYPNELGTTAPQLIADFAAAGPSSVPTVMHTMMALWIIAAFALFAGSLCLRMFVLRLPTKTFSPRPMKPSSWVDFTVFNLVVTIGIAAFPLGWVPYAGAEVVFLTFLATKLTVLPLLGAFAYWSLFTRFDAFNKLTLLVPVLKALSPGAAPAAGPEGPRFGAGREAAGMPPPSDDDMSGIGRVK